MVSEKRKETDIRLSTGKDCERKEDERRLKAKTRKKVERSKRNGAAQTAPAEREIHREKERKDKPSSKKRHFLLLSCLAIAWFFPFFSFTSDFPSVCS